MPLDITKIDIKGIKENSTRNLHSPSPKNDTQKLEVKEEEEEIEMEVESDPGEIDMTCKEELMDFEEEEDSPTIRTVRSASNERQIVHTGEKEFKVDRLTETQKDSNIRGSYQRTREQTNNQEEKSLNNKRSHLSKMRKDYSSLKRNLADEFNNISNGAENLKKDTLDENSEFQEKIPCVKTPIKEEIKQNLLG